MVHHRRRNHRRLAWSSGKPEVSRDRPVLDGAGHVAQPSGSRALPRSGGGSATCFDIDSAHIAGDYLRVTGCRCGTIASSCPSWLRSPKTSLNEPMLESTLLVSTGMKMTFELLERAISRSDSMYFIIIRYCAGLPCPFVMPTAMWRMDSASAAAAVKRAWA